MNGVEVSTDVLVVGAGPVGLTLALALGRQGIGCRVVERRREPDVLPRMELCNGRTMEIFHRLGVADLVRRSGWPLDASMDSLVLTTLADPAVVRLPYPSAGEMQAASRHHNDGRWPGQAYQRISQYTLAPLLARAAGACPSVQVTFGYELTSFEQDVSGVTATLAGPDGSQTLVRSRFLVGCDGGDSSVRRLLGIQLEGLCDLARLMLVFFRSAELGRRHGHGMARHYNFIGPRGAGLISQDDGEHYALHVRLQDGESPAQLDPVALVGEVCAFSPAVAVRHASGWSPHLLLAERYSDGRVFLAGDAVHQYVPTGGLGMNTGIGDAADLAWKLGAYLNGWGGRELLASYESERRPVGQRNLSASAFAAQGAFAWRSAVPHDLVSDGDTREQAVQTIAREQRKCYELAGAEFGYRYDPSAICTDEGPESDAPVDTDFGRYTPSTAPGSRLPHLWRSDGVSVYDCIGDGLTLLELGPGGPDTSGFAAAGKRLGVPLRLVRIPDRHIREVYGRTLLLIRPDQHVAWRGDTSPEDPGALLATATGRTADGRPALA
jgi:2-polyprenyl-6-methoxyphenol hydroxylase-like FAD-dependent oxidoreductase